MSNLRKYRDFLNCLQLSFLYFPFFRLTSLSLENISLSPPLEENVFNFLSFSKSSFFIEDLGVGDGGGGVGGKFKVDKSHL